MKITIAQLRCDADDDVQRAAAIADAFNTAGAAGADLLVLPELAASGYRLDRQHLADHAEAADASGPMLSRWCAQAARHRVAVVGGFAERLSDGRVANSAAVIDRDGAVLGTYQKLHLFATEAEVFVPGASGLPVFGVAGATVGVAICYDLRFPEVVRILAGLGADVIAVPTAWVGGFDRPAPGRELGHVRGALVQANLSQVVIACADQVDSQDGVEFLGSSLVAGPYGEALAGPLPPDRAGITTVDVELDAVRAAAERASGVSPRRQRRTDVYDALLGYRAPGDSPAGPITNDPEVMA